MHNRIFAGVGWLILFKAVGRLENKDTAFNYVRDCALTFHFMVLQWNMSNLFSGRGMMKPRKFF